MRGDRQTPKSIHLQPVFFILALLLALNFPAQNLQGRHRTIIKDLALYFRSRSHSHSVFVGIARSFLARDPMRGDRQTLKNQIFASQILFLFDALFL